MGQAAKLQLDYPRLAQIRQHPAGWWRDVLAVVHFEPEAQSPPLPEMPSARVMLPVLNGADGTVEVWRLAGPMQSGRHGRVQYRRNGRLLFAALSVAEQEFALAPAAAGQSALWGATQTAYRELFDTLSTLGFEHPLRIWNFLPEIHGRTAIGERYWHFNHARQEAFVGGRRAIAGTVPAASALGSTRDSPLTIFCIASASAPIALENPRQRSAWSYPARYGPRSPTFARACIESGPTQTLFISGTASIVGHESAHAGDVRGQTQETLRNVRAVLAAANARVGGQRYALDRLSYKVYVRRPEDLGPIDDELRRAIGAAAPILYLQADICRRELLVELEATGS
jgi:enamine deaminase RidA (YjgF/YER057c/UK114 family)